MTAFIRMIMGLGELTSLLCIEQEIDKDNVVSRCDTMKERRVKLKLILTCAKFQSSLIGLNYFVAEHCECKHGMQ